MEMMMRILKSSEVECYFSTWTVFKKREVILSGPTPHNHTTTTTMKVNFLLLLHFCITIK